MKTIYSPLHRQHAPESEFNRGHIVQPFERPERADRIVDAIRAAKIGSIEEPAEFPIAHAERIHAPEYVEFIRNAYAEWAGAGRNGDALPIAWAIRGMRDDVVPKSIDGRLSLYSFDGMTPITSGTWTAVKAASDVALTAAREVASGATRSMFALCRPPGHHAAHDYYGGYCFLNNAGMAAQYFLDQGAKRVAILDVDYHHGNGTQAIFYERADVLFVSIHADPSTDFPYFLGNADERGRGAGEGFNLNLPLARGADWARWSQALDAAKKAIASYAPDALIVSLGLDTFEGDELSTFKLKTTDFSRMGAGLAELGLPTVIVLEGGYGYEFIGANVVNVLTGFEGQS